MTKSQEKAIETIRALGEKLFYGPEHEFKRFEVKDCGSFISVFVEIGRKNDEGTLAAIFCRETAHLFVGKRGGITYPVNGGKTKRFEGYSLLQAVCDQRW